LVLGDVSVALYQVHVILTHARPGLSSVLSEGHAVLKAVNFFVYLRDPLSSVAVTQGIYFSAEVWLI